ncbi:MAG: type I methionyl aminopeptidase [Candidatus Doudnabacteria bacterium]|nr:type I methionyl aminopeptidase [Candidatus Doudnabacteria bacterium]
MKHGLIKTEKEIHIIAEGGKLLRDILYNTAQLVKPDVSTWELNKFTEEMIAKAGGRPSFKGFGPNGNEYPAGLCTSVNDEIVHGIPSKTVILKPGDIIGLDIGMEYKNLYTDTAITVTVGQVSDTASRLISITKKCLDSAVKAAKPGQRTGDIGFAIQTIAEQAGFSVVRDLVGHGVGYSVHEDPQVPCYGRPGQGMKLQEGMVLAIEPMLCEKGWKIFIDDDGWTIRTADGGLAAHFEHTVAIEKDGAKVLT